ncbi:hypothetical protein BN1708_011377 [Verticillium longisporum]|uniref:Uncharacterized protein n=1 Tax=Verticillium longisporum TaxID=100787 RepID=A0A0G4KZF5_VERLO|nr:hypothetical protein BN1708_011377 [Verticillium longisporum]
MGGNQALSDNSGVGQQADLAISVRASDWYYTVCAIMGASTIAFLVMASRKRQTHRLFHYITASITLVACIAYFSMGSRIHDRGPCLHQ